MTAFDHTFASYRKPLDTGDIHKWVEIIIRRAGDHRCFWLTLFETEITGVRTFSCRHSDNPAIRILPASSRIRAGSSWSLTNRLISAGLDWNWSASTFTE